MEKILNFAEPLDVNLLDRIIECMYQGTTAEREQAQTVLTQLKQHAEAWTRVDTILEYSRSPQTKFFALIILEEVIKYKWKALPREQCDGIKNYVVNLVIKLSSDANTMQKEKLYLSKLNYALVLIIKQEWPGQWQTFIPDIVGSSKTNESLCENNMNILKILSNVLNSEEVFDFSRGQMTQSKITALKQSFNKDFGLIYELCEYILNISQKTSLILVTLETLLRFLNWIPIGYIFETSMIDTLSTKFLMAAPSRNVALQCLTEIGSLVLGPEHNVHFERLFRSFMTQLIQIIPPGIGILSCYLRTVTALPFFDNQKDLRKAFEQGSDDEQNFIQNLSLFFSGFLKSHIAIIEASDLKNALLEALRYLALISLVENDEVFKICLEYWNHLASDIYHDMPPSLASPILMGSVHGGFSRRVMYGPILTRVRAAVIGRMAKPEEVLIVEDENGQIVRELLKDSDAINLYKSMKETLVYLTNLDPSDTQNIMLERLAAQVDGSEWSWHNLNTLCWAIGSISGALNEELEQRFLVTVIRDLLGLVELKRGKDNKAVIASNIMYIVGQYPRFLRAHWKFLKTVVNKLFEFMHETHPGIQDMSCDTFLKIVTKCKRKFAVTQIGEPAPFIEEILSNLQSTISDLENHQIQTVYESLGHIIATAASVQEREALTSRLMSLPNTSWADIMANAGRNIDSLRQPETIKHIANILKTNNRAATSLGHVYISQLSLIFADTLNVYKVYSGFISNTVATQGPMAAKTSIIMNMRAVKKETLRLFETFIERTEDPQTVCSKFIPPLLEAVLGDYKTNIPDARDPEVLSLMVVLTNKMKNIITPEIPRILEAVFECTLGMITKNFEDYPEHRINFFRFIRAVNAYCFAAFFSISAEHFKLVIDCIVWAFKHTERNISETGLLILQEMLQNVSTDENVANAFYQRYFLSLLQDVFFVLTDSFHKAGFKLQTSILLYMVQTVDSGLIKIPLSPNDSPLNNQTFVKQFIYKLISFPNLKQQQVETFVLGLFTYKDKTSFKSHLRDFLVLLKEFSSDAADLYLEEQEDAAAVALAAETKKNLAIPGMVKPSDRTDDMAD